VISVVFLMEVGQVHLVVLQDVLMQQQEWLHIEKIMLQLIQHQDIDQLHHHVMLHQALVYQVGQQVALRLAHLVVVQLLDLVRQCGVDSVEVEVVAEEGQGVEGVKI
jgi:hypothetical protein